MRVAIPNSFKPQAPAPDRETSGLFAPLLRPRDAARILAISERSLWAMTAPRGPIPAARLGRAVR